MIHAFATIAFTPAVRDVQARDGSRAQYARAFESGDSVRNAELGPDEAAFIHAQRSFYVASSPGKCSAPGNASDHCLRRRM
jgi:uncharacterized protein